MILAPVESCQKKLQELDSLTVGVSTLWGMRHYFLRPRLPTTKVKSFSPIEANFNVLPLTALLSALTASDKHCDDCISFHPHTDSIINSISMSKSVSASQTEALDSALVHLSMGKPSSMSLFLKKENLANWNKLRRLNSPTPMGAPAVVFLSLSHILDVKSLPHLTASSKETCRNVHLVSLTLMMNARENTHKNNS